MRNITNTAMNITTTNIISSNATAVLANKVTGSGGGGPNGGGGPGAGPKGGPKVGSGPPGNGKGLAQTIGLQRAFAIIPKVTATLSLLGSLFIIYDVLVVQTKARSNRTQTQQQRQQEQGQRGWLGRLRNSQGGNGGGGGGGGGRGTRNNQSRSLHNKGGLLRGLSTYHRLLLSMSICDVMSSIAIFFSTWAMPAEDSHKYWLASGNTQTCTAQGFFVQLGSVGTILFNVSLSTYYYLSIRKGWRTYHFKQKCWIEPFFHIVPYGFALTTAVIGIIMGVFNAASNFCYIASVPKTCNESWRSSDDDLTKECRRGDNATLYRWLCNTVPKMLALVVVTLFMWLCHRTVVTTERKTHKHVHASQEFQQQAAEAVRRESMVQRHNTEAAGSGGDNNNSNTTSSSNNNPHPSSTSDHDPLSSGNPTTPTTRKNSRRGSFLDFSSRTNVDVTAGTTMSSESNTSAPTMSVSTSRRNRNKKKVSSSRSKRFAIQSFLYVGALYVTLLPEIIHRIVQFFVKVRHPSVPIILAILAPLQGFFNALVYIRPRYLHAREVQRKNKERLLKNQEQEAARRRLQQEQRQQQLEPQQQQSSIIVDPSGTSNTNSDTYDTSGSISSPHTLSPQQHQHHNLLYTQCKKVVHTASDMLGAAHSAIMTVSDFDYNDDQNSSDFEEKDDDDEDDVSSTMEDESSDDDNGADNNNAGANAKPGKTEESCSDEPMIMETVRTTGTLSIRSKMDDDVDDEQPE